MEAFMNLEADTIGLNALPSLLGELNVAKDICNQYREALRVSPDPYIREFPGMRRARGSSRAKAAKKNTCVEPSWTMEQYQLTVIQPLQKFDTQLAVDMLNLDTNADANKDFDISALLQETAVDLDLRGASTQTNATKQTVTYTNVRTQEELLPEYKEIVRYTLESTALLEPEDGLLPICWTVSRPDSSSSIARTQPNAHGDSPKERGICPQTFEGEPNYQEAEGRTIQRRKLFTTRKSAVE